MFKVIKFELRKLVSRPGIYVLAVILAGLLIASAFAYNPIENKKTYNILSGSTINEINTDFNTNFKAQYDEIVTSTESLASNMSEKTKEEYKAEITSLFNDFSSDIDVYINISVGYYDANQKLEKLKNIHNEDKTGSLDVLYNNLIELLGKENSTLFIATTQSNYSNFNKVVTELKEKINRVLSLGSPNDDDFRNLAISCDDYKNSIYSCINNLKYIDYSSMVGNFVEGGNFYKVTIERHDIIIRKMNDILSQVKNNDRLNDSKTLNNEFNDLFNEYRLVSENYLILFETCKNLTVLDAFSETDMANIKFLDIDSYYSLKETKTKYTYYMEKDSNELDYANALSFDYSSNEKANSFDYTYFAISIFSVVVMIFAITLGAYSIAGETKDGTMRFISMKPVSRSSLYWGKFFAIALISLIMLVFSTIASLIVGGAVFGFSTSNILTIINATNVVVVHPTFAIIIFVASMFLQILVYLSIAMMFSSFLKSDLLSMILTVGVYIINMLLPLFFNSSSWLCYNPFTNINLYAYVGAGTITANSILGQIFSSVVYHGVNILASLIFIMLIVGITNMIGIHATKKREF